VQVDDIRESRVYQEGKEEALKEGIAISIAKMAAKRMSATEIAAILEVDIELVHQVLAQSDRHSGLSHRRVDGQGHRPNSCGRAHDPSEEPPGQGVMENIAFRPAKSRRESDQRPD
jgi:hypothetical protein